MKRNPYEVLGVPHGASLEEIKRAYRKKAKECHPDLHPDDPKAHERMQEVNEAYTILCNPDKRQAQQESHSRTDAWTQGYQSYAGSSSQQWRDTSGAEWFDFEDIFGARRGWSGAQADQPHEAAGDSDAVRQAIRAICAGQYARAADILSGIPGYSRDGRWNYLCGVARHGMNDDAQAVEYMRRAIRLEPNNEVYRRLLHQYMQANTYEQPPFQRGGPAAGNPLGTVLRGFALFMLLNFFMNIMMRFSMFGFFMR